MNKKVIVTGISVPENVYQTLENKRGSVSRSRYYVDLIKFALEQEGVSFD